MKILLIANPRTGSTYLGKWLSKKYKLPYIHEPVFVDALIESLDTYESFCMKVVTGQFYYYNQDNEKLSDDDCIDYFYNLLSKYKFDKILVLDRRNEKEHIEAIINLDRNRTNKLESHEWVYNDGFKKSITEDEWNRWKTYALESKKWLTKISNKFNIPIVYYEDVYYDSDNVDLQGLEFKPDLSKKYRKNSSNTII